jgi:hypothetical protein
MPSGCLWVCRWRAKFVEVVRRTMGGPVSGTAYATEVGAGCYLEQGMHVEHHQPPRDLGRLECLLQSFRIDTLPHDIGCWLSELWLCFASPEGAAVKVLSQDRDRSRLPE